MLHVHVYILKQFFQWPLNIKSSMYVKGHSEIWERIEKVATVS